MSFFSHVCNFIYLKPQIGEHKHKTKNMTYNNKMTLQTREDFLRTKHS